MIGIHSPRDLQGPAHASTDAEGRQLLTGYTLFTATDAPLPVRICARHLELLGAHREALASEESIGDAGMAVRLSLRRAEEGTQGERTQGVDCTIHCPYPLAAGERMSQAQVGLMAVHGRDQGRPRPLGLDVASVVAGIIATQGVLAAHLAHLRAQERASANTQPVTQVESSVLQSALWLLVHHLAIATCGDDFPMLATLAEGADAPGPPFATADGQYFEVEALQAESWVAFWHALNGVPPQVAGRAWLPFVLRYLRGQCALPAALHAATQRHTLEEACQAATASGVVLCRVRNHAEVVAEYGIGAEQVTPWLIQWVTPGVIEQASTPSVAVADRPVPDEAVTAPGKPLAGMTVVEVTSRLQGPLAGLLLQMLGAHVIKVEPPGGDFGRHAPPLAGTRGAAYLAYNHGKQVVEIDYKQAAGKARLLDLIANADLFLHNWPAGRAESLGLTFAELRRRNPQLVYVHASAWGSGGTPPAPIAGDFLVQAHAACGERLNPADEPPFPSRVTLVDVMGGLLACEGALVGLCLRQQRGQGCGVETSLLAAALQLQEGRLPPSARDAAVRPQWDALARPIATVDGYLLVCAEDETSRRRLAEICAAVDTEGVDTAGWAAELAMCLAQRPAAEWALRLRQAGIPATVVCSDLATLPDAPHMHGLLMRVDDACWLPAAPWHFADVVSGFDA